MRTRVANSSMLMINLFFQDFPTGTGNIFRNTLLGNLKGSIQLFLRLLSSIRLPGLYRA